MRLTVYTDYALRLLMYLALKEDGCATIREVAQAYGISKSHLMKVAHQLGVAGYIATVRGKGAACDWARPHRRSVWARSSATPNPTWRWCPALRR